MDASVVASIFNSYFNLLGTETTYQSYNRFGRTGPVEIVGPAGFYGLKEFLSSPLSLSGLSQK